MKLYGSYASPFVRRIRIILHGQNYDFVDTAIMTSEGKDKLKGFSPLARIPLLVDDNHVIWDSTLIAQYLLKREFNLNEQKDLCIVNELTDSGLFLYQMRKYEIDPKDESALSQSHISRINEIISYIDKNHTLSWDLFGQWLYCALDWFRYRSVYNWEGKRSQIDRFMAEYSRNIEVKQTHPSIQS